ncbi:sensor histidine kinase [Planctomicrobium sp. SH527]|uniref:sensor histidine kinase n=1 Tax=Planctomicrobium sp. SH527 TaxID=3448123 RepID=UPI003F5B2F40
MTSDSSDPRRSEPLVSPTQLLERCPPWLGAEKIALELLTAWSHNFSLNRCLLLWSIPHLGEIQGAVQTTSSETLSPFSFACGSISLQQTTVSNCWGICFPPLTSFLKAIEELNQLRSGDETWIWHTVQVATEAGIPEIAIALPAEFGSELNHEWLSMTGTLLTWAIRFQHELQTQKLESLAEYSAGAGHEINNPLGSIIGRTSQLLKEESNPERKRALENIGAQAYRVRDMIGDTMSFARPPLPRKETRSPAAILNTVLGRFQSDFEQQNILCSVKASQDFLADVDRHQIEIVFSELIRNSQFAISSMPSQERGSIEIEFSAESRTDRDGIRIDFKDTGPGLDPIQRLHAFDPFYSGRQAGRGLGFGLSKCWQILRLHGGSIEILPQQSPVILRLWLPASPAE